MCGGWPRSTPVFDLPDRLGREFSSWRTPCYVYDLNSLVTRVRAWRSNLNAAVSISYSVKANPNAQVLKALSGACDGADVASAGELQRALEAGFPARGISFVGPAKTSQALESALALGVAVVAESPGEARSISEWCSRTGRAARVYLRLQLGEFYGSLDKKSRGPSQFGLDPAAVDEAMNIVKRSERIEFAGIHGFFFSQHFDLSRVIDNLTALAGAGRELERRHHVEIPNIIFGPGLPAAYHDTQSPVPLSAAAEALNLGAQRALAPGQTLTLECGRYLTSECGYFLTRVVERKRSFGKTFLLTDGGLNHNLALAGFGSVLRRNFQCVNLSRPDGNSETVTVCGPTCYSADILGHDMILPETHVGDILCFPNWGAYGPSFSPVNFLSFEPPAEYALSQCN